MWTLIVVGVVVVGPSRTRRPVHLTAPSRLSSRGTN